MNDFIEVIDAPLNIHFGTPFVVDIEVQLSEPDSFDIIFEIMGKSLFFEEPESSSKELLIVKKRIYNDSYRRIVSESLIISGDFSDHNLSFPIRSGMWVYTQNSHHPDMCKLNIYPTYV